MDRVRSQEGMKKVCEGHGPTAPTDDLDRYSRYTTRKLMFILPSYYNVYIWYRSARHRSHRYESVDRLHQFCMTYSDPLLDLSKP